MDTNSIIEQYLRRDLNKRVLKNKMNFYFDHYARCERELIYLKIIKNSFVNLNELKFLEIGAGDGANIFGFKRQGLDWSNIYANELITKRINELKNNFPSINIFEGDACNISEEYNGYFDIILQSTVFTSILNKEFKEKLAIKIFSLLKTNGILVWYDFIYNNPQNKDVRGINKKEIINLFPQSKSIAFYKVTLAPPIGRKIKNFYPYLNCFKFLRTHLIAEIRK